MAQQDEGIMALNAAAAGAGMPPEDTEIDMQEFRRQTYPVAKDAAREVNPEAYGEMQATLSSELAGVGDLDPEGIKQLLEVVDYINDNPDEYAKVREALIKEGVIDEDDFPEQLDVEYFATLEVVLQEALMGADARAAEMVQGPAGMMPPQGFAKGGIAEAAQLVAGRGRYGDTMLAHITPEEARLLKARGGSGTINPETGLPEFFKKFFKKVAKVSGLAKVVKAVHKAVRPIVKKVLASPIGRMAVTIGLTMIGVPPPLASALVTKAGGGSWKDAFKAAAVSYLAGPTSPIAKGVTSATPFLNSLNPAVATGLRSGLTATGAALLTGSNLKEAVTSGVTSGLVAGIDAARNPIATPDAALEAAKAPSAAPGDIFPVGEPLPGGAAPAANLQSQPLTSAAAGAPPTSAPFTNPFVSAGDPSAMSTTVLPSGQVVSSGGTGTGFTPPPPPASFMDQAKDFFSPATDFYNRNISPSGIREAGEQQARDAGIKAMQQQRADFSAAGLPPPNNADLTATYNSAVKSATPGIISQYAPMAGAGLGVMALTGGFSPREPDQLPMADRISAPIDVPPNLQLPVQNLPGVEYDDKGNIIGSTPFNPATSPTRDMRPTEVATPGIMSLPMPLSYIPPPGAPTMGMGPIAQPFNTASMYGNLMQPQSMQRPRGYNAGGIAGFAQGGYPRRIGQIDGPGTETSDDIPAMLSDGEFVMTARAVRGAGNGSRREGAKKMYSMMHQLEKNAARG